ncbi:hypothetical protein OKW21_005246 [Catalinimonas alkaloidigena]|uniref:hypothetical protein n=1 Tax=Catalinimonas alkaloidigena TaxID=1075417 RepID=UPI002405558F|nr:hypothetical protein [Catalinimonas alkaloidigena]MDF9799983.1 hypothetical protein [Catalinimonas alkaloidigena]
MKRAYLSLILCCITLMPLMAQEEDMVFPAGLRFLDYNNNLPDNLLHTKSVVFVDVPVKSGTSLRGDWQALAKEGHRAFKNAGIDAVAYYNLGDVEAGKDASIKLAEELKSRQIENIILLSQVQLRIAGKDAERFAILITDFNEESSFISHGQEAYKEVAKDTEKLFKQFDRDIRKSGMTSQNHLIADQPEFFTGAGNIVKGRRAQGFAQDLKLDKLAVPQFEEATIPDSRPGGNANKNLEKEIVKNNKNVKRNNLTLKEIMNDYPYEYALVDPSTEEDKIRQDGYQFILLRLNTTGENIKEMLGYEVDPSETDYVTLHQNGGNIKMRHIPAKAPVYKYYIKHIYTGDVYLGNPWDADESWEEALANYIGNMKKDLNIGR